MIRIRETAPTVWTIYDPIRGTYNTAFPTRAQAQNAVRLAILPGTRWITDTELRQALVNHGFEAQRGLDL